MRRLGARFGARVEGLPQLLVLLRVDLAAARRRFRIAGADIEVGPRSRRSLALSSRPLRPREEATGSESSTRSQWTSCERPRPTSADCSICDEAVMSPAVATLLPADRGSHGDSAGSGYPRRHEGRSRRRRRHPSRISPPARLSTPSAGPSSTGDQPGVPRCHERGTRSAGRGRPIRRAANLESRSATVSRVGPPMRGTRASPMMQLPPNRGRIRRPESGER